MWLVASASACAAQRIESNAIRCKSAQTTDEQQLVSSLSLFLSLSLYFHLSLKKYQQPTKLDSFFLLFLSVPKKSGLNFQSAGNKVKSVQQQQQLLVSGT